MSEIDRHSEVLDLPSQLLLVGAVRQVFWLARGSSPTYESSVYRAIDLAPRLIPVDGELARAYRSATVLLYRQRAAAYVAPNRVDEFALQLMDDDIERRVSELEAAAPDNSGRIRAELRRLQQAREDMSGESWTEHRSIERDARVPERYAELVDKGLGFTLYRLSDSQLLAVRVLHPDPVEIKSGADLVYETYGGQGSGDRSVNVRLAVIQYKRWDGGTVSPTKVARLECQLHKLRRHFCDKGLCDLSDGGRYRLPGCCTFLRLTDIRQTRSAWHLTSGRHYPTCHVLSFLAGRSAGGQSLSREDATQMESVSQETFQDLYRKHMLGSRWLTIEELEAICERCGMFRPLDRIVVHARDVCL